jgi:hypothetical protein
MITDLLSWYLLSLSVMMMLVAEKEWDDVVDDVVDDDVDALPMIAKEKSGSAMSKIYFLSDDVTVG